MLCTVADLLRHCCEYGNPEQAAIVDGECRILYGELLAKSLVFGEVLREAGLKKGDRVAIYLPRSAEAVVALLGTFSAGGVAVILNDVLRPRQVKYIVEHSETSVIVTNSRQMLGVPDEAIGQRYVLNVDHAPTLYKQSAQIPAIGKDLALISYTSGSTGPPRGVMVRHDNLLSGAEIVATYLKLSKHDKVVSLLPFSFDYGLNQLLAVLQVGATLVIQRSVLPANICHTLRLEGITGMALVPMLWLQLIDRHSPFLQAALPNLRYITNTGGRVPVSAIRLVRKMHPHVSIYLMYGLTEAFRSTYLPPDQVDERPTSIGKAIPNVEILIVNERGGLCAVDEVGELVHRGATVTNGYWRDPASTAKVFRQHPLKDVDKEGEELVVFSGDLVKKDAAGYMYFVGRRDQLLKSRGFRVSPDEIEHWVFESNLLSGVVAFAAAQAEAESEIVLAVVPKDPEKFREEKLQEFCKREMPAYMRPRSIWTLEHIPLTSSGKPDRVAIQRAYYERSRS
jgi:acyl-CoA synthetase (AMP-forming)/AMP-acid ligase II